MDLKETKTTMKMINNSNLTEKTNSFSIKSSSNLPEVVQRRYYDFLSLIHDQWIQLLSCPLSSARYKSPLNGESSFIPIKEGMRHFVLWSLYPTTKSVSKFIEGLDPSVARFFDDLQNALGTAPEDNFPALRRVVEQKFSALADKLPEDFDSIIFKTWEGLKTLHLAQANDSNWSELDFEKHLYSIIDSLLVRNFLTVSNRQSVGDNKARPDFQVSQVIDGKEYILLLGEDEKRDHTPISHKDSYKLFEHSRRNQRTFSDVKFKVPTYGILNGGVKFTLFEFARDTWQSSTSEKEAKKYNVCWIRDENDVTFTYCFAEFSKILKVLVILYHSLIKAEDLIKYFIENPEQRTNERTSTTFFSPEKPDCYAMALDRTDAELDEENDEDDDEDEDIDMSDNTNKYEDGDDDDDLDANRGETDNGQSRKNKIDQDSSSKRGRGNATSATNDHRSKNKAVHQLKQLKQFRFCDLFPADADLLGYSVESNTELHNINRLDVFWLAKWCFANNRSVPYEVEIISKLPLYTVPQPVKWASVDDNKYHVIVFPAHYHCDISALYMFRSHAFEFIRTIQYIHEQGLLHGDIKLDNTSCDLDHGDFYLFDFGHSCKINEAPNRKFGTRGHRAPEYLLHGEYTIASEMFSFGVWLIEWFFQKPVQSILAKYRPNFSVNDDELKAVDTLLEVFEEYSESKPFSELWRSHFNSLNWHGMFDQRERSFLEESEFQILHIMVRDLLNKDPAKRPTCHDLLTDLKYSGFLRINAHPLVIPKEEREDVTKHLIYSPGYQG